MKIIPQAFAHNFGPTGTTIYCTYQGQLYRAIARNEITTQQVSVMVDDDGKAYCLGHSPPQRIEAYNRVDRFYHAQPQEEEARDGGYWFIYERIYGTTGFYGELCPTRHEFWLGGSANALIATYDGFATPAEPIGLDYYATESGTYSPIAEYEPIADFSANYSGGGSSLSMSWDGNVDSELRGDAPLVYAKIPRLQHSYEAQFSASVSASLSCTGDGDNSANLGISVFETTNLLDPDIFIQAGTTAEDGDTDKSATGSYQVDSCVFYGGTGSLLFVINRPLITGVNSEASATATISVDGTIQLRTYPQVLYCSRDAGGNLYTAIRWIRGESDPVIDYFKNEQKIASFDSELPPIGDIFDWRAALLQVDPADYIPARYPNTIDPTPTGDSCIDQYQINPEANLIDGILRRVNLADLEILKTQASKISYTSQFARSEETCVLVASDAGSLDAIRLPNPVLQEGETASTTTILWAAP